MNALIAALAALAAGASCLAPSSAIRAASGDGSAFDATQIARYAKRGAGRIDGLLVLRTGRKGAVPKPGVAIECYPDIPSVISYLRTRDAARERNADASFADVTLRRSQAARYVRVTKTTADGQFHFRALPHGRYVLRAGVVTAFPRTVYEPLQVAMAAAYGLAPQRTGERIVYDYTHAWFESQPLDVGARPPVAPAFHLVSRHDDFDPRR